MDALGTKILVRTISKPTRIDKHGNAWNYHSRSDHHSKVACWGIVFDLLRMSPLLRRHVVQGRVAFGINHEMRDFRNDRRKNLDLVICQPASGARKTSRTLAHLAGEYEIELTVEEQSELAGLPALLEAPVGNVLVALEAKACMTAHQRALPRLYDELNSSHQTIHGAHNLAVAAGFVMINIAGRFLSPDLNKRNRATNPDWSRHDQPKSVDITVGKVKQLPRRSKISDDGYDALCIAVVECVNDGSPVRLHTEIPAPQPGDTYHYVAMVDRLRVFTTRGLRRFERRRLRPPRSLVSHCQTTTTRKPADRSSLVLRASRTRFAANLSAQNC